MAKSIVVDPAVLKSTASSIENVAAEYKRNYEQLLTEVDAMGANWQGADNQAYTAQIKGFTDGFNSMYNHMIEYVEFLNTSATAYQTTQDELTNAAKQLIN